MASTSIRSKPCTVLGCDNPRFAKGYCKYHQNLRTDKKAPKPINWHRKQHRPSKPRKRVKEMSDKQKALIIEKKAVYTLMSETREMVCTGCRNVFDPEMLEHSHIIPVSRWKEGMVIIENITYHGSEMACGCHRKWETHNPNITKDMLDYEKNMAYIKKVDPEYYQILINKLPD